MRSTHTFFGLPLAGFGILAALALGQTADQAPIRVGTRLVQINVIVHDKNGPVGDLTKEDFILLDRGKIRSISVFRKDTRQADDEKFRRLASIPPNVFSNTHADAANTTIILFDALNTRYSNQAAAKRQVLRVLGDLRPDDHVGIYMLGQNLRIIHEFSSDTKSLLEAVRKLKGGDLTTLESDANSAFPASLPAPASPVAPASNTGGTLRDALNDMSDQAMRAAQIQNRAAATLEALRIIAHHVERMAGRKNLVWVSSAFPVSFGYDNPVSTNVQVEFTEQIRETADALMRASIAVYPVDARGLAGPPAFSGSNQSHSPAHAPTTWTPVKDPVGFASEGSMQMIASRTGGKAFYNTNNISGSVRRAIDDSEITYTLGFYLSHDEIDSKFHDIKVKVDRQGVDVRTRKGYLAYKDPESAAPPAKRVSLLHETLTAPLDSTAIPVAIRFDRADSVKPGAIQLTAYVDARSLVFANSGGNFKDSVDVVVAQQAASGAILDTATRSVDMNLPPDGHNELLRRSMTFNDLIEPKPGVTFVRVVVFDRGSGQIGSVRGELGWILAQSPPAGDLKQ